MVQVTANGADWTEIPDSLDASLSIRVVGQHRINALIRKATIKPDAIDREGGVYEFGLSSYIVPSTDGNKTFVRNTTYHTIGFDVDYLDDGGGSGSTYTLALAGDTLTLSDGSANQNVDLLPYKDAAAALATTAPLNAAVVAAVGTALTHARADHQHQTEGPSGNAGNLMVTGTDGKALLTMSATEQSIPTTGTYLLGWVNGTLSAIPA